MKKCQLQCFILNECMSDCKLKEICDKKILKLSSPTVRSISNDIHYTLLVYQ